jgi:hypothetical protein
MGYSLSQEQYEKLQRNKAEGRLCCVSTGRGGCFTRATRRLTHESWPYESDRAAGKPPTIGVVVACTRHSTPDWQEGLNFRTIKVEKF